MNINILDYFEATVKKHPQKIAIMDHCQAYSYSQVMEMSKKMAMLLMNKKKSPILVLCNRDVRCLILFWGVIYSGNFYVPIDEKVPLKRLKHMVDHTNAKIIVSIKGCKEIDEYCCTRDIKSIHFSQIYEGIKIDEKKLLCVYENMLDIDPLYMVYTSGSTGKPKGVLKTQKSVLNFLYSFQKVFSLREQDVFANQVSFDFDVAAKDIFLSMYVGATLVIIPKQCFMVPKELIIFLNKHKVTILIWSVAAIRYVASSGILAKEKPEFLRKVFFSGEVLQMHELKEWIMYLENIDYINLYAPTEVTGNCMYYIVDQMHGLKRLPLGLVFPNMEVMVLKEDYQKVKENEIGEIYIRGAFLSQGYYQDLERTKKSFVQNPLHHDYLDVVYKTGDLARQVEGQLYFIGRVDHQIKHMGYRIELEEIEQALYTQTSQVNRCCAIYDVEKNKIILILQGEFIKNKKIRSILSNVLPKYMIPHQYIWLDKLPENIRGKLDRKKTMEQYLKMKNSGELYAE